MDQVGVVTEQVLAAQNCNKMRDDHLHKLLEDHFTTLPRYTLLSCYKPVKNGSLKNL